MQNLGLNNHINGRLKNPRIQVLRGIAILAVVIIHLSIPSLPRVIIRPFINYAVALFVFLSGYLTPLKIKNIGIFYWKRITRIIVPYVLWSIIYSIPKGFGNFWVELLTGKCCGIYYYIFVYFQLVIITPLVLRLIESRFSWVGWIITPIGTIIFRYLFKFMGMSVLSSNFNYTLVAWFIYYYLGLFLGNKKFVLSKPINSYIIIYAVSILISIAEGLIWYRYGDFDMATTQLRLSSILTSISFMLICHWFINIDSKHIENTQIFVCLHFLGNCSFGIYLSHILIKQILDIFVGQVMLFPIDMLLVISISAICVAIGKKVLGRYSWLLGL